MSPMSEEKKSKVLEAFGSAHAHMHAHRHLQGAALNYTAELPFCSTTPVPGSVACKGSLCCPTLWSWFHFVLEAGITYVIEVNGVDCQFDPVAALYRGKGTTLTGLSGITRYQTNTAELVYVTATVDDFPLECPGPGNDAKIYIKPTTTGNYSLAVGSYDTPDVCPSDGDLDFVVGIHAAFTLINVSSSAPIGPLVGPVSAPFLGVNKLDFIANFFDCPGSPIVKSVRLTFDNPATSRCERNATYAVFGNATDSSTYVGATIPVGERTITATAYTGPNCNGAIARMPHNETFFSYGCDVQYKVYNARTDAVFLSYLPYDSGKYFDANTLTGFPCAINIEAVVNCKFLPFAAVTLELLSGTTVVKSRNEKNAPYFLFGDIVNGTKTDILPGALSPGNYSIRVRIADIIHTAYPFTLNGTCVP